ncbi:MAG: DUF4160 domain-containing protein [Bacteroidetes bacterium]|nr:MAG: DUF4160 domain-containing protein [Bacteroidota bacterium]
MPTILRIGGFRFFFYSNEGTEPPHIHVERADAVAKFWLETIELSSNYGFNSKEIRQIHELVEENRAFFISKWNEHFGN